MLILSSGQFANLIGSGTFSVDALVQAQATVIGGVNFTNIVPQGSGSVTVEFYNVPEPATAGLICLGGIGLLLRRRRVKA